MPDAPRIERVSPQRVRPLRAAILRPGRPPHESIYPLDEHADSAHFGAINTAGEVIGSASVFQEPGTAAPAPFVCADDRWRQPGAWRLRGMTVDESRRGGGTGAALLQAAIDHVRARRGRCLWFHARTSAAGFYERFGFAIVGATYDVPHLGAHVFMWRSLEESANRAV